MPIVVYWGCRIQLVGYVLLNAHELFKTNLKHDKKINKTNIPLGILLQELFHIWKHQVENQSKPASYEIQ